MASSDTVDAAAAAALDLADARDRPAKLQLLFKESGLTVREFLEVTLSSIQPGGY
jgi:hypothetical protein